MIVIKSYIVTNPASSGGGGGDQNLSEVLTEGNDGGGLQIKNIADPTEAQDVATKAYVDAAVPDASETVKGKIEILTQAETDAGTDDIRALTALKFTNASKWSLKEDVSNKSTSFSSPNNTKYPSVQAVLDELLFLSNITSVTGSSGVDSDLKAATALDRIPSTGSGSVSVGRNISFIASGVRYTATLKSGTLAEAAPYIVRPNDYATTTNEKYWEITREFNTIYLPQITGYLGSSGSDTSIWQATAIDRIPTTSVGVGARISAIVTISGTQRRLYTAELVTPVDSTAAIELSPSVIRPNDFNSSTNNKVWREIKMNGIIDVSNFGVVPDPSVFVSDQINAIITAASAGDTLIFPPGNYKIFSLTINKQLHLIGLGAKLTFSTVNATHMVVSVDLTTIKGFTFVGQGRSHATYPLQGALRITACSNVLVQDCIFDQIPHYAIQTDSTHISDTSGDFGGINIVNCLMTRAKYGFRGDTRGEYVSIVGCSIVDCDTGTYIACGNINVTGCNILDCSTVGVDLVSGTNDAHGTFVGNQINHNAKSIRGNGITNGQFFRGNNIYYGDMEFTNCAGIEFWSNTIEGLEMKYDNCTGCKVENNTIPGVGGTIVLTTNWNSNQSDVFAYNNKNLSNKLIASWNQSPLLSLYQHTSTAAVNQVVGRVKLNASEVITVRGFVLATRVDTSPNDYTEAYYRTFEVLCRRQTGGNITKVGENLGTAIVDGAFGGTIALNVNTTDQTLEVQVQPDADDTLWTVQFNYTKSSLVPGLLI